MESVNKVRQDMSLLCRWLVRTEWEILSDLPVSAAVAGERSNYHYPSEVAGRGVSHGCLARALWFTMSRPTTTNRRSLRPRRSVKVSLINRLRDGLFDLVGSDFAKGLVELARQPALNFAAVTSARRGHLDLGNHAGVATDTSFELAWGVGLARVDAGLAQVIETDRTMTMHAAGHRMLQI